MFHTPNERARIGRRVFAHEIAKEEAAREYIDFFNEARPSYALGYLALAQYKERHWKPKLPAIVGESGGK